MSYYHLATVSLEGNYRMFVGGEGGGTQLGHLRGDGHCYNRYSSTTRGEGGGVLSGEVVEVQLLPGRVEALFGA